MLPETALWIIDFLAKEVILSGILFLLIGPAAWLLRKRSPLLIYGLWLVLFVRLVFPPQISSSFSLQAMLTPVESWISLLTAQAGTGVGLEIAELPETETAGAKLLESTRPEQTNSQWPVYVFLAWFSGISLGLGLFFRRRWFFRQRIQQSNTIDADNVLSLVNRWKQVFKISRTIRLVTSSQFDAPFTTGLWRPVIFIPQNVLDNMSTKDVESVIAHEMAHIKRLDDLWLVFQNLVQIIYFFHPLAWIAGSRLNDAREHLCDWSVLQKNQLGAADYGRALVNLMACRPQRARVVQVIPGLFFSKKKTKARILKIMEIKKMNKNRNSLIVTALILFAVFILPMAPSAGSHPPVEPEVSFAEAQAVVFGLPITKGSIASNFGKRRHPILKEVRQHNGIDISAKTGTEVYAAADGLVNFADMKGAWGKVIFISHPQNIETRYGQLSEILVTKDQHVKKGQLIGKVGSSGRSTGPHLHFEIRKENNPEDPKNYLDFSTIKK